ncbi:MAG TPA: helix-turn-helix transcriptional regulator [Solirubrobacteraceae bacterium]|nr:helix-turn-helix transcriptional regulator [Solirubrobacteraceae bacterium]
MAPKQTTEPRPELASLALAIKALIARDPRKTQASVARAGDIDLTLVNSYACGRRNPTYLNLVKLARGIGVEPKDIFATVRDIERVRDRDAAASDPAVRTSLGDVPDGGG